MEEMVSICNSPAFKVGWVSLFQLYNHKRMGGAARHMAKKVTKEQYETLQSEVRKSIYKFINLIILSILLFYYYDRN